MNATPEQVRDKVRQAYLRAVQDRSTQWSRVSSVPHAFRDARLYGGDAGADFAQTHLDTIVQEAIETAGRRGASLSLPVHGWGRAASEGLAQALRDRTGLEVELGSFEVVMVWGDERPRLV